MSSMQRISNARVGASMGTRELKTMSGVIVKAPGALWQLCLETVRLSWSCMDSLTREDMDMCDDMINE